MLLYHHKSSAIAAVDLLLMTKDGRQTAFGPKNEMLKQSMPAKVFIKTQDRTELPIKILHRPPQQSIQRRVDQI